MVGAARRFTLRVEVVAPLVYATVFDGPDERFAIRLDRLTMPALMGLARAVAAGDVARMDALWKVS